MHLYVKVFEGMLAYVAFFHILSSDITALAKDSTYAHVQLQHLTVEQVRTRVVLI